MITYVYMYVCMCVCVCVCVCMYVCMYGTAQRQRRTHCLSCARTRLKPSSLQLESRSTLGLQQ